MKICGSGFIVVIFIIVYEDGFYAVFVALTQGNAFSCDDAQMYNFVVLCGNNCEGAFSITLGGGYYPFGDIIVVEVYFCSQGCFIKTLGGICVRVCFVENKWFKRVCTLPCEEG